MLEDRDYMREQPMRVVWSATTTLTVILIAVYALECINNVYLHTDIESWLALTPACFTRGRLWQLITFQFLHASLWHIACNLIVFWWVGHFVENILGTKRFLVAMFGCGVIGGMLQDILMIISPEHFGYAVVGASAGVSGLFAIFALLEAESKVYLYFILPIRAITLLWAFGLISLFFTLVPTPREGVAHAAHLGGLLAGIAWVKLGWHHDYVRLPWEGLFDRFRQYRSSRTPPRKPRLVKTVSSKGPGWSGSGSASSAELPEEEFISQEVDPILDKISAHGIQSLTERERKILEAARKKMAKR
ncbi:MAG TPA: rhomboid family intramembrane serine protease [Verrucomicrobiae bacterium]|nr:rhomboid family intramembrane serine protease [Verrucomicrobiae bacterium]